MYHTCSERTSNHATCCAVSKIYRQELPAVFNILLTRCLRKVISNTYPNMWQITVYYISKKKAFKPAMRLGSVLNWTPCTWPLRNILGCLCQLFIFSPILQLILMYLVNVHLFFLNPSPLILLYLLLSLLFFLNLFIPFIHTLQKNASRHLSEIMQLLWQVMPWLTQKKMVLTEWLDTYVQEIMSINMWFVHHYTNQFRKILTQYQKVCHSCCIQHPTKINTLMLPFIIQN